MLNCPDATAPGTIEVTESHGLRPTIVINDDGGTTVEVSEVVQSAPAIVEVGIVGPQGPTGDRASISADPENMIREGMDGKIYARMEWTGTPNW